MMRPTRARNARLASRRCGFSLVEAVMACAIAGGLLVAALSAVGATAGARRRNEDREMGVLLARDLLAEVLARRYADKEDPGHLGLEVDEAPSREFFDDIDDYDAYLDKPASTSGGEPVTGQSGWQREVSVRFVKRDDLGTDVGADEGIKRVVVTASRSNGLTISLTAMRTAAWDALMEAQ